MLVSVTITTRTPTVKTGLLSCAYLWAAQTAVVQMAHQINPAIFTAAESILAFLSNHH